MFSNRNSNNKEQAMENFNIKTLVNAVVAGLLLSVFIVFI